MLVKCLINDLAQLNNVELIDRLSKSIHLDGPDRDLVVGGNYKVQAIEIQHGSLWYYLHTVDVNDYPLPYPAEFFSVMDGSIPEGWIANIVLISGSMILKRLSFTEWANDDAFYEKLIDEDVGSVNVYLRNNKRSLG
ncbi:MAG TPA: hypothetical protein VM532_09885 [Burkholderiales bacterium]|jgi:hypothetical protein|nr:hypothetical protein [Burkholderiales bacterium]